MNPPSRRTSSSRKAKGSGATNAPPPMPDYNYGQYNQSPQLFNDTSGGYMPPYPPNQGDWNNMYGQSAFPGQPAFPGQQLLNDPMASMAMHYGQAIAGQGKQMVEEKLEKYVSISKVKYYFAVDTAYVTKKLTLLFFPFTHKEWAVRFNNQNEPVAPRYDVNAPDLYIPFMAFVTYILITGYILGSQDRFSPEQLGIHASSALGWSLVEIAVLFLAVYLSNTSSYVKFFDLIAFCSYKYVSIVAILIACVSFQTFGYYGALIYCSISLGFFLIRTLRVLMLPKTTSDHFSSGGRHNSYLLLGISFVQPFLMYILTKHLIPQSVMNTAVNV